MPIWYIIERKNCYINVVNLFRYYAIQIQTWNFSKFQTLTWNNSQCNKIYNSILCLNGDDKNVINTFYRIVLDTI